VSAKRSLVSIDAAEIQRLLDRVRALVSGEDYAIIAGLATTISEVTRIVREQGATIARLRRFLGQTSSEKTSDVLSKGTAPAGDTALPESSSDESNASADAAANDQAQSGDAAAKPKPKPKGHGRIPASAYKSAEPIPVAHPVLRAGGGCPDCPCGKLHPLDEPATIVRIFGQAPLVAHRWNCERLRCGACGTVFTAKAPQEAQGPKYSESAAAMMAVLRYGRGLPLNRLEGMQRGMRVPVPASTQWEVVHDRIRVVQPVYDELVRRAADGDLVHTDDTYVRILEFMGKRRAKLVALDLLPHPDRTGLFTTGIVSQTASGPIALFCSGRQHAGENLAGILAERDADRPSPIHMCDGLDRNAPKGRTVLEINCLAHGRRHVVDQVASFPEPSAHLLEEIRKVFEIDADCRERKLTALERLEVHQRDSGPVMAALEKWMRVEIEEKRVEPNSGLGDAFNYLLKRWSKLTAFLRLPGAPLDNNIVERALKKAIQHRRNSLFYRTLRGARVGDIYMALIYTAELHKRDAFAYLTALFLHEKDVAARPDAWLPWTFEATLEALATTKAA
jgi:transposase